jgi:hypothetical protein
MISSAFIAFGAYVASFILLVFPDSQGLPDEVSEAATYLGGYLGILDPLVPVSTLLTVLTLLVTFELAIFAFKAFRWLFSHVPWVGGN